MLIEGLIALAISLLIAAGVGYFVSTTKTSIAISDASYCEQFTANLGQNVSSSNNNLKLLNIDQSIVCAGVVTNVLQSAPDADPLCPNVNTGLNIGGPAGDQVARRRTLLCGEFSGQPMDAQRIRGGATWAQNFYINCANTAGCGIPGATGNLHDQITGTPLSLDTDAEIQTFYDLLPTPLTFPAGGSSAENNPAPARIDVSIRPMSIYSRNATYNGDKEPLHRQTKRTTALPVLILQVQTLLFSLIKVAVIKL